LSVIDDIALRRHLPEALELARRGPIPLERLRRVARGSAGAVAVAEHGEAWTRALVDLCERAGVGRLERDRAGQLVLVACGPLPSVEEAWETAAATWPPLPSVEDAIAR
jgi:hypothetical protein